MPIAGQKLAFVMASSSHGTMIVNRFDYRMVGPDRGYGGALLGGVLGRSR
jgi:hypothetical protein